MRAWGITMSFLATQLGVSRQYAWQIVYYRTQISLKRAHEIEGMVDTIIAQEKHIPTFGDRLRAARVSAGLTLKEVANIIGYTWVGIERWEKNVCRPKPGVLWHLCSVYGVPASPMLAEIPSPKQIAGIALDLVPVGQSQVSTEALRSSLTQSSTGRPNPAARKFRYQILDAQGPVRKGQSGPESAPYSKAV